ncbi:cob(I)yrinic acid a,c-diamide adenosyltransferase [Lacticaseibacillus hulanensis]|uniref:cob(I)yrinic acid a,c-diamide adenosyltransferase n=1 Tax=Lacticaseibacillus hulanensis TaxID=2493111 RepID=UPI000FDAEB3B|nr:cob(I)yrinic acid a,c-diamide adenosyltransferase [Lacticaseibacillus hulanensis]
MKIYTKVGDHGQTKQVTGHMVSKTDPQIEALGAIDEFQSYLGVAVAALTPATKELGPVLQAVQRKLYVLQADLAVPRSDKMTPEDTTWLEAKIDEYWGEMPHLNAFIIPGGLPGGAGAHLQFARTLARRAERAAVALSNQQEISDACMTYLNRVSDFLFAAALYANWRDGYTEIPSK